MSVKVHPLTQNPTAAWKELSKTQKVIKINVSLPKNDVPKQMVGITICPIHKLLADITNILALKQVRFVCMSDTHSLTPHIKFDIPDGDVFIHAGDFTRCGGEEEVVNFSNWIGKVFALIFVFCIILHIHEHFFLFSKQTFLKSNSSNKCTLIN